MAILRRLLVRRSFAAAAISPASPAHLPAQATTLPSAYCVARCARVRPCATESHPRSRYPIPRTRRCLALRLRSSCLPSFAPSTAKRLELLVGAGTGHLTSVNVHPCQRFDGLPELRSPRPRSSARVWRRWGCAFANRSLVRVWGGIGERTQLNATLTLRALVAILRCGALVGQ